MNPFEVLGVAQDATPEQIKSAYRKMAMKHHPDQHGGSEEAKQKFQEIQSAYDQLRSDKPRQQEQQFNGMHDVHDMFEQMFRQHFRPANVNFQALAQITLLQAFEGCTVSFNLPSGKQATVAIPAGVHDGQHITVQGMGGTDHANLPPGHLIVIVRVMQDVEFGRQGDSIITKVDVDLLDAILGCQKEVNTLTGETVMIDIPANTRPNAVITVSGKGMVVQNTTQRGDMLVYVMVTFRDFTEDERLVLMSLR